MSLNVRVSSDSRALVMTWAEIFGLRHMAYEFGKLPYHGSTDCSGLAKAAWAKAGVVLPHNTVEMSKLTGMVEPNTDNLSKLKGGDLIYYRGEVSDPSDFPGHVAVYLFRLNNLLVVAQATNTELGTEVIKHDKYEEPVGLGFIGHN